MQFVSNVKHITSKEKFFVGFIDGVNNALNAISNYQTSTTTVGQYVHSPFGLFPMPVGQNIKQMQLSRVKSKFKFLGKFMAKAIMDSRMVRKHFSIKREFKKKIIFFILAVGLAVLSSVLQMVTI